VLLALAGSGLGLAATVPVVHALPNTLDSTVVSGWVLADLNGDHNVDLATARSGRHDVNGYTQEVRITLGAFQQTSFHFRSPGATVELTTRDVDGDHDGDLIVFEPLSSQPIGVWINDGAGSFHEGRLADFRKLWSDQPGPAWRVNLQRLALLAVSEDRTQSVILPAVIAVPELTVAGRSRQYEGAQHDARRSDSRPRAPPCNS
jgi:hypothetical protein